jgi:hypothetical protein
MIIIDTFWSLVLLPLLTDGKRNAMDDSVISGKKQSLDEKWEEFFS